MFSFPLPTPATRAKNQGEEKWGWLEVESREKWKEEEEGVK